MISIEEKTYVRIVGDVGQSLYVTIPHDIRVKEGIEKGDELEIRSIDGKIVMEKKEDET